MLFLRVLGQLDAHRGPRQLALGGQRTQIVLALLALDAGRVVDRSVMVDALWEQNPPASAVPQVAIHISTLRKVLGKDSIETVATGYRLRTDDLEVDTHRAEQLIEEGHSQGNPDRLADALRLWHGRVLSGLESPALTSAIRRWEELRLDVLEDWAALESARGGHRRVITNLTGAVGASPLREGLRARLMEALWQSGRQADALQLFREGRDVLTEELGLEPGVELRELHARILEGERDTTNTTDGSGRGTGLSAHRSSAPRQLPVDVNRFSGRASELAVLNALASGEGARLIALHGPAGAGKTSLAAHWGHLHQDTFPGGQLFVNLRGFGTHDPLSTTEALEVLFRQLGLDTEEVPSDEQGMSQLFRTELDGARTLLVLDNAHDSDQVRSLVPGGQTVTIVTSRTQLRGLAGREGAQRVAVEEMTSEEAVGMLQSRLGAAAPDGVDLDELKELAELCGRLPVALAVAAERAGRDRRRPLSDLIDQLRRGRTALDALTRWQDDPTSSVRAVLEWSYRWLRPSTARALRLVGLHPHPTFDMAAAACLIGTDLEGAAGLLDRLVDGHLLVEVRPDEFEMHDLVRAFATEKAHTDESDEDQQAAVHRMRSGYLHAADAARRAIHAPHMSIDLGTVPEDVTLPALGCGRDAVVWLERSWDRLDAVVADAAGDTEHEVVYLLVELLDHAMWQFTSLSFQRRLYSTAEESAVADGNDLAVARARHGMGRLLIRQGDPERALDVLAETQMVFEAHDDPMASESCLIRGLALHNLRDYEGSIRELRCAVTLSRAQGRTAGSALNNLARALTAVGRAEEAVETAHEALRTGEGNLAPEYDTLGEAYLAAGRDALARDAFQEALERSAADGDTGPSNAEHWFHLGLAEQRLGRTAEAVEHWRRALDLLDSTDWPDNDAVSRKTLRDLIDAAST